MTRSPRSRWRLSLIATLNLLVLALSAAPAFGQAVGQGKPHPSAGERSKGHFLGLRFDAGKAYAFGLGYVHGYQEGIAWFGYGLDVRVITEKFDAVNGGLVSAVGRLIVGDAPPVGFEVAAGLGNGANGVQGAAHVGVFISFGYYFEIGYTYQFPIGPFARPEWLSSHQFSLRVQIPLYKYDEEPIHASASGRGEGG